MKILKNMGIVGPSAAMLLAAWSVSAQDEKAVFQRRPRITRKCLTCMT